MYIEGFINFHVDFFREWYIIYNFGQENRSSKYLAQRTE